ncbi:MAG: tetratricopeptide repeat protein [Bacteroidia bacterium]|nr:tetratricopeptide repeat protein [Bacteroidia bacterium]
MSEVIHKTHIFDETGCLNLKGMRGYLDGSLSQRDKALAAAHLKECELCEEALDGIALVKDDSLVYGSLAALNARIQEKTGAQALEKGSGQGSGGGSYAWMWQAAAAVAALAVITWGVWTSNSGDQVDQVKTLAENESPAPVMDSKESEKPPLFSDSEGLPDPEQGETDANLTGTTMEVRDMESKSELKDAPEQISMPKVANKEVNGGGAFADAQNEDIAALDNVTASKPMKTVESEPVKMDQIASATTLNRSQEGKKALVQDIPEDEIAMEEITVAADPNKEDAYLNGGYQTDVYSVDDDKLDYKGTKRELNKRKDSKDDAPSMEPISQTTTTTTRNAATKSVATKGVSKAISPPAGVYYDSDKSTWSNAQTLQDEGMSHYDNKNFTDAVKSFEEVIAVDPANREARFYGGVAYFELGLYNNAEKHFQYLTQNPSGKHYDQAQWYLAEIHVRRNELQAARKILKDLENGSGEFKSKATERLKEIK